MTNHEAHIKLWNELAKTGSDEKGGAFEAVFGDEITIPLCHCFACEAALDYTTQDRNCNRCPISWGGSRGYPESVPCTRPGSPFDAWCNAETKKERKRLAKIIRDLPWRERS